MKERVLITGASGFVGFHLIEEALHNNLEVFAAVRGSSQVSHLQGLDVKFTTLDFEDVASLKKELNDKKYDYIIHAAGITKARSAREYNHINAGYTHNLALAAMETGSIKKFVLIGSLAAVGPLNTLNGFIDQDTIPHPVTAYGKSKLLAEEKLRAFTGLRYTILRPTGIYGPRDKDIFIMFKQINKGLEPYIGKMEQKFSFLYVKDLAKATIRALYAGNQKTYILADGNFYNRYELADITKSILNVKTVQVHLPVNFVKLIALVSEKLGSLKNKPSALNVEKLNELMAVNWACDIEPAKSGLGFYPQHNLEKGLKETLDWYKQNKWL